MLSKQYRLTKRTAFTATYKNHDTIGNRYVVVYRGKLKKDDNFPTKVGFVVNKKYHKRAVVRNRTKRIFREVYRILLKENKINSSNKYQSLIFVIKNACLELNYRQCYDMVLNLLK